MNNEQTSTCTEAPPRNVQPRLSGRDREIALQAIAARATGTPVEAAYQILAGIEALDKGPEAPLVMLWPKGDGFGWIEDRAAWLEAERDRLLDKVAEAQRVLDLARQRSATTPAAFSTSDPDKSQAHPDRQVAQKCSAHQQPQAEESSARGEEGPAVLHLSIGEPHQGASDE